MTSTTELIVTRRRRVTSACDSPPPSRPFDESAYDSGCIGSKVIRGLPSAALQ